MPRHPRLRRPPAAVAVAGFSVAGFLIAVLLTGCAPAASKPPPLSHPIAVFQVAGDETYRIELITPELVKHAEQLLDGDEVAAIPLGKVVRTPGVNAPWSWHIDPTTLEFADVTVEVCDGLPSYVEDRTVTSPDYCPWSAKVVKIER